MFVFLEIFIQCILTVFTPLYLRCPHLPTYPTSYSVCSPLSSLSPWAHFVWTEHSWAWGLPCGIVSAPGVTPLRKTGSPSPPPAQSHASSSSASMGLCAHLPCSELGFCLAWAYVVLSRFTVCEFTCPPTLLCLESAVFLMSPTASGSYNLSVPFPHRSLNLEERGLSTLATLILCKWISWESVVITIDCKEKLLWPGLSWSSGLDSVRLQAVPGHWGD